jgi:hypothetical protein
MRGGLCRAGREDEALIDEATDLREESDEREICC